jgi:transposase
MVDPRRKNKPPLLSGNKHYHHLAASPESPATNNQAERARRDAVIAWRIFHGARTEEGSAAYAATMSVLETCQRRGVDAWAFITDLLADAHRSLPHRDIPLPA